MWKKVDIVFKLKSPLHIGYLPFKGSVVSPTRYYVPGRNLWGAVTKRITEYLFDNPNAKNYRNIGRQVMENFRFSYFYLYDEKTIYFPHYTDEGLEYGDNKKKITKAEFEHKFIGSIISTAIDRDGTAKNKSLHEIEFINNKFKDKDGNIKPVMIAGCIWIKRIKNDAKIKNEYNLEIKDNRIFVDDLNIISELILGGESKYGFGHLKLSSVNKVEFPKIAPFKWKNPEKIEIKQEPIIAHLKYAESIKFKGELELLTGRGYFDPKRLENDNNTRVSNNPGKIVPKPEYYFSPGTVLMADKNGILDWDGTLIQA